MILGKSIPIDYSVECDTTFQIRSLSGCAKLHSLTDLNVSGNKVADLDNVFPVATLPNLQCLNLQVSFNLVNIICIVQRLKRLLQL